MRIGLVFQSLIFIGLYPGLDLPVTKCYYLLIRDNAQTFQCKWRCVCGLKPNKIYICIELRQTILHFSSIGGISDRELCFNYMLSYWLAINTTHILIVWLSLIFCKRENTQVLKNTQYWTIGFKCVLTHAVSRDYDLITSASLVLVQSNSVITNSTEPSVFAR